MKSALLPALVLAVTRAHAGFGGMGNVDADAGSGEGLGLMIACACIGAAAGYLYCVVHNQSSQVKRAPDGGAVVGLLLGGAVLPFLWIYLNK